MPGERLGDVSSPTIRFQLAREEFSKRYPGFERKVQGIELDSHGEFWVRSVFEASVTPAQPRPKPCHQPSS